MIKEDIPGGISREGFGGIDGGTTFIEGWGGD